MFCLEGCPPNPGLHATWLIGALFEFFRPHFGLLLGKCARAAAAKRVKPTVRRRLHPQASEKDEKEGCTQAIMRPSFKQMGL